MSASTIILKKIFRRRQQRCGIPTFLVAREPALESGLVFYPRHAAYSAASRGHRIQPLYAHSQIDAVRIRCVTATVVMMLFACDDSI
jgi:hypothetical protein